MNVNRVEEMVEASKAIDPRDMSTWVGVWYDFKTNNLLTTSEKAERGDATHAYVVGQMIRPNTEAEVRDMVRRWMYM